MKLSIFNAALLAGWFLLTLGGILLNPGAGLVIAGIAIIGLTVFVALRFGVYEDGKAAKPPAEAGDDFAGREGNSIKVKSFNGR